MVKKQKKEQTIMEKLLNKEPVDQINIFMQSIILFLLILFVIMSIFVREFEGVVKLLMSLLLFFMAYNNVVLFKRKGIAIVYSIIGVYFMVIAILEAYGS